MSGLGQDREVIASPSRTRMRGYQRRNGHGRDCGESGSTAAIGGNGTPVPRRLAEDRPRFHIRLRPDPIFVALFSLASVGVALWLASALVNGLGQLITVPAAAALIGGIALIPSYLSARLISSLLFEDARAPRSDIDLPPITLIVAADNDEDVIEETLHRAAAQDYPGELRILVADDASTDETVERAIRCAEYDLRITVRRFPRGGRTKTLNRALAEVDTTLGATIDGDTLLMPDALKRCAARLLASRESAVAVVPRPGALLAADAFSVYKTSPAKELGVWRDQAAPASFELAT